MDLSLSVVWPVHNAQHTLAADVHKLLEVLPDITSRFEILIVDDGSTDQTEEIAHELSLQYPQLRVTRHQTRRGPSAAIETGMTQTTGDMVFVHDEATEIRTSELRALWDMRHDRQLVMARAQAPRKSLSPHLLGRLSTWGEQLRAARETTSSGGPSPGGIQMIRREAVEDLEQVGLQDPQVRICQIAGPNFLTATSNPVTA